MVAIEDKSMFQKSVSKPGLRKAIKIYRLVEAYNKCRGKRKRGLESDQKLAQCWASRSGEAHQ